MKKVFILLLFVFIVSGINVKGYESTGHEGITDVTFYDGGNILSRMSRQELYSGSSAMGKNIFWGWKTHYFCIEDKASYIGEIVFSKSNKTSEPLPITYAVQESYSRSSSIKVSGGISASIKGMIKAATISGSVDSDIVTENKEEYSVTEKTNISFVIQPNCKITYRVTGDCYITNGLCNYYAFWIKMKKGNFELIEFETRYYELVEEEM
ncbi:MAG: hypothetical protein PHU02_00610 [Bacilli bacterium]|jgi:hypothetical protein|nr:hypothetical protein [Bacilli bacterium]MDD2682487.1 hypothetical protein [Bacilli bacterium]MDD3121427.1 hypothetical protein [Bacilli bacterium]MDD4063286.1 hypothetical protein [Bacilli bacterium]MDD4482168.1 hypothetical protein [Bacilli bacterium]